MQVVNWKMISHPMNWLTFMLMVIIAGAFVHYVLSYLGVEPSGPGWGFSTMPAGQSSGLRATGAIAPQGSLQV
jgi:hypothetical protein